MSNLAAVLALIAAIETGGEKNPDAAIGDGGKAHGRYQIHAAVVADVNRVYRTSFTLADAHDAAHAKLICQLYLSHWMRQARLTQSTPSSPSKTPRTLRAPREMSDAELALRIWNGGPNGWKKPCTLAYWNRRPRLNQLATDEHRFTRMAEGRG